MGYQLEDLQEVRKLTRFMMDIANSEQRQAGKKGAAMIAWLKKSR